MLIVKKNKYGRGVYTTTDLRMNSLIITNHLLMIPEDERTSSPTIKRYDFEFHDYNFGLSGIALGLASLINHSLKPNAEFFTGYDANYFPVIEIKTIKTIKAGSQILIDYGYDPKLHLKGG